MKWWFRFRYRRAFRVRDEADLLLALSTGRPFWGEL